MDEFILITIGIIFIIFIFLIGMFVNTALDLRDNIKFRKQLEKEMQLMDKIFDKHFKKESGE